MAGITDKSEHAVKLKHVYYGQGCTNVLKDVSLAIPMDSGYASPEGTGQASPRSFAC